MKLTEFDLEPRVLEILQTSILPMTTYQVISAVEDADEDGALCCEECAGPIVLDGGQGRG